ncbi:MAG TPA: D-alanyl-D-alanine carboxypeptidase family protein [Acetobacteraceae bacterium]|jgi:D-alanyl-D-alanine carboxypeptidase|nr:D-alanyl-D-alanine carboxypeptidase family protein [Acetobacteraceae bacterium]
MTFPNELDARLSTSVSRLAHRLRGTLLIAVAGTILFTGAAWAQIGSDRYSSIVIEAASGNVMEAANPDEPRHPASLTKMMTLYMVFEALRDRRINRDQLVPVSLHAAAMEPSKLGLLPATRITVEEAILGLVTKSANDAASALGELLGGDEDRFAEMMTLRARALGMSHTVFRNASGLPDPDQITTARDLAMLARRLILDFPVEYKYFSTPNFIFHGHVVYNHDQMLQRYPGADGIKTGFVNASGHNIATSAVRNNVRLIGIVMGAATNDERDRHMASLLDAAYERLDVPLPGAREVQAWRLTNPLISSAQAATTVPAQPQQRLAAAHVAVPAPPRAADSDSPIRHGGTGWGVQVGAFNSSAAARQAAAAAYRVVGDGDPHVAAVVVRGKTTWRAQLLGLTEGEMHSAVGSLGRHRLPAQPIRPETERVASR